MKRKKFNYPKTITYTIRIGNLCLFQLEFY